MLAVGGGEGKRVALMQFITRKVILNKFSCIKFPKNSKRGTGKEPRY